jgi:CDP-diacylglycerol--glycerol-3-phosphate 3-phosphatidyltransferase
MERAERLIALGIGLLFNQLLIAVLWLMLVGTLFTAGQRFVKVWRQASVAKPVPDAARRFGGRRTSRTTERSWRRRAQNTRR